MGHGKETPRQKMIGMMYLVLMALLALNVSKEVLDAFAVLDTGLVNTIETLQTTNEQVIKDFGVQYELNKKKVEPWQDKALQVKEKADNIVQFIYDKKIEMLKEANEDLEEVVSEDGDIHGDAIKAKDNTEVPGYVMYGDNNDRAGKDLHNMIEDFRNFLVQQIVTSENAGEIRKSIESGLDTEPKNLETHSTETPTWESQLFLDSPLSGVLTIMSGLQINVRNAESEALKYLYGQIDAGSIPFNKLDATIIPNSNYIIRGNQFNAQVFMAASDTTSDPVIWVTNNSRPYDSTITDGVVNYSKREGVEYQKLDIAKGTGKGIYSMPASSLGSKFWGGLIELTGPSGTITKPFRHSYLVAEGAVTVAPTKMNVFYLGVDNPVDVSVAGVQPDQIDISVTNARHERRRGSYIIKPIRPGNAYVVVYARIDGKRREMGRKEFRVKTVPNPVAMVNNQKGGLMNQQALIGAIGVVAEMESFDFDLKFTVTEFTVSAVVQGFVREYTSKSNRFTQDQKSLLRNLSRGQRVYIQDIKAVGPDGSTRSLSTINFKLN